MLNYLWQYNKKCLSSMRINKFYQSYQKFILNSATVISVCSYIAVRVITWLICAFPSSLQGPREQESF